MAPVVTGEVDPGVLEDLIRLCVQLDRLRRHDPDGGTGGDMTPAAAPAAGDSARGGTGTGTDARVRLSRTRRGRGRRWSRR